MRLTSRGWGRPRWGSPGDRAPRGPHSRQRLRLPEATTKAAHEPWPGSGPSPASLGPPGDRGPPPLQAPPSRRLAVLPRHLQLRSASPFESEPLAARVSSLRQPGCHLGRREAGQPTPPSEATVKVNEQPARWKTGRGGAQVPALTGVRRGAAASPAGRKGGDPVQTHAGGRGQSQERKGGAHEWGHGRPHSASCQKIAQGSPTSRQVRPSTGQVLAGPEADAGPAGCSRHRSRLKPAGLARLS